MIPSSLNQLAALLLCFLGPVAFASGPIKYGISASNAAPLLYQFDNKSRPIATGGFIYEMTVAIAEELQDQYSIVTVPRNRLGPKLASGNIDVICHTSNRWNLPYTQEAYWSKPLYAYSNVLVARHPIPFGNPSELENTTVGTVANSYYADLEKSFKNKRITREDAPSVEANVIKLMGGRIEYVVMSDIEFIYYKMRYPEIQRSSFSQDKTDIQCTLSKKSPLTLEKLNKAIDRLTEKKVLQKIHARYNSADTFPKPLTYGLNNNDSPPFLFFDKNRENEIVKGGVFFDIALALGKHLQRPINFVLLPRGRLDAQLADGQLDFVCYDTEAWAGKYAKEYNWSLPIFKQINYVVYLKSIKPEREPKTLADLKGATLGTVLHFIYPTLKPYFDNGSIRREDADSGGANLKKLQFGRVNYIVINNLEFGYYKKLHPSLQKAPIDIDPIDVKCAVSKKSDLKVERINQAITEMQNTGKLQKVFDQ